MLHYLSLCFGSSNYAVFRKAAGHGFFKPLCKPLPGQGCVAVRLRWRRQSQAQRGGTDGAVQKQPVPFVGLSTYVPWNARVNLEVRVATLELITVFEEKLWKVIIWLWKFHRVSSRLFQVASEEDAMNWFPHYALTLRPFYETLPLKAETTQPIVDCIRSHPDWSSAHVAIDTGLRECLKHNYVQR